MNTINFKTIQVNEPGQPVTLLNPYYVDPYTQMSSRQELCNAWHKENELREKELIIFNKTVDNYPN